MMTWTLNDAKDRLSEVLRLSVQEPQILYDQKKPVGVVVNIDFFNDLMNLRNHQYRPTMAELLDELSEIHKVEPIEIEIPKTGHHTNPIRYADRSNCS